MEKFITDKRIGLLDELVGDYYLIVGGDKQESISTGVWIELLPLVRITPKIPLMVENIKI